MILPAIQKNLLRQRGAHEHSRVTYLELFFDLVFVFAVTQISHFLLHHQSVTGALETAFLALAVWWVWVFTSWVTNWLDPEKAPVRILLLVLMLAGLLLSCSLPDAFGEGGLIFAGAYVFMQVGRSLFTLLAVKKHSGPNYRNFLRITAWLCFSGIFWTAGAMAEGQERILLWVLALGIEYLGPIAAFWVPGRLGRTPTQDWDVEGGHMSERCALFIIIALGESILATGATFAELPWSLEVCAAFLSAFAGSIALWWIYFDTAVERGAEQIVESDDPGRLARMAYTYIHVLIVAGVIVCAVGDELALAHPMERAHGMVLLITLAGPALFLIGNILFKAVIVGRPPASHIAGLAAMAALGFAAPFVPVLGLAAGTTLVLICVAAWETVSLRGLCRREEI